MALYLGIGVSIVVMILRVLLSESWPPAAGGWLEGCPEAVLWEETWSEGTAVLNYSGTSLKGHSEIRTPLY